MHQAGAVNRMKRVSLVTGAAATSVIAAGIVLIEAALLPGVVIGGAAVLVPRYLPRLRRRLQPLLAAPEPRRPAAARSPAEARRVWRKPGILASVRIPEVLAKTVTFRVVVITLDFGANYLVLGEPVAAAGLSAISLVGGPVFYLVHEVAWNRAHRSGLTVSAGRDPLVARAVVKTITYRTFATAMEFTTNYVVVGDVATAALLSAFGFIVGPFLYFGHEMAWGRLGPRAETAALGRAR